MNTYEKYTKDVQKFGRMTMILGMIAVLLPALFMAFYFKILPPAAAIIAGTISQISVSGAFYISEPISYYPILGSTGLYVSTLSGNSVNMKIPAAATSIEASGYKAGTEEGQLMGTMGVAVSVYVAVFFVILATALGQGVISNIPDSIKNVLTLIIPALYGGIFAQFSVKSFKTGIFALVVSFIMTNLMAFLNLKNLSFVITLTTVFSSIAFAKTQLETIKKNS